MWTDGQAHLNKSAMGTSWGSLLKAGPSKQAPVVARVNHWQMQSKELFRIGGQDG